MESHLINTADNRFNNKQGGPHPLSERMGTALYLYHLTGIHKCSSLLLQLQILLFQQICVF